MRCSHRLVRTVWALVTGAAILGCTPRPGPVEAPGPSNLDPVWEGQARRLVAALAEIHPNPWRHTPREAVLATALTAAEPGLGDEVRRARFTKALARVGEGHTRPATWVNPGRQLPLRLERLADGWVVHRVEAAAWEGIASPRDLLGARLVAVGGQELAPFAGRIAAYACADNAQGVGAALGESLVDWGILADLGVVDADDRVELTWDLVSGDRCTTRVGPRTGASLGAVIGPPAWSRSGEGLWWARLEGQTVAYLAYNVCQDGPSFDQVVGEFLEAVGDPQTRRVIVDLRYNSGGNSWPFTSRVLPALQRYAAPTGQGPRLVVLAGAHTFSSAIMALVELRQAGATFVGEPTIEGSTGWGEVKSYRLGTAGYEFITSTKLFTQVFGVGEGVSIEPDLRLAPTRSDFLAGRDPVLEAALGLRDPS